MSMEVVTREAAEGLAEFAGVTAEQVMVVQRTVAKGATVDELAMFLKLSQKYDLDPFAKEIWCIVPLNEDGSRKLDRSGQPYPPQINAGRDGFLKIANRHEEYEGKVSGVVYPGEHFILTRRAGRQGEAVEIEHTLDPAKRQGEPLLAYCAVWRSDREKPEVADVTWAVYGKPNARDAKGQPRQYSPWAKYPDAMLKKVAESIALRQAFSVSGVTSEEELAAGDAVEEGSQGAIIERAPLRQPEIQRPGRLRPAPGTVRKASSEQQGPLTQIPDDDQQQLTDEQRDAEIPFGRDPDDPAAPE